MERVTVSVTASISQLLCQQKELSELLEWSECVKTVATICSPRPSILVETLKRCVSSRTHLFDDVASIFIDSLTVNPSPLGKLPPLEQWPAPSLITWEASGVEKVVDLCREYIHPLPTNGLTSYLKDINDHTYLQEQMNRWLRFWKPLFPRFAWPTMRASLVSQKEAIHRHGRGLLLEHTAYHQLQRATEERFSYLIRSGGFSDTTLDSLEVDLHEKQTAYADLLCNNRGVLDWYRSTSFFLTGHTASTQRMGQFEFAAARTLESSAFGDNCLDRLKEDTSPFFVSIPTTEEEQVFAPVWGVFMAWVSTGGLQQWLPQVCIPSCGFIVLSCANDKTMTPKM